MAEKYAKEREREISPIIKSRLAGQIPKLHKPNRKSKITLFRWRANSVPRIGLGNVRSKNKKKKI